MKQKKTFTAYFMVHAAAIAAIYVVLTMLFAPISFGPVQFRISEALCILPYFTPAAVPGVVLGCLLSNLLCGAAALDVIFGSDPLCHGDGGNWRGAGYRRSGQWPAGDSGALPSYSV